MIKVLQHKIHKGITLWFTGLSGSGKTTIAAALEKELKQGGCRVERLDGDEIREHFCRDLGFSREDRDENIRRVSYLAKLLTRNDIITLCCFVSPYRKAREEARALIGDFAEIFINTPLAVCEERDVKGLYARARKGELPAFTGVSDPYEPPLSPELEIKTNSQSVDEAVSAIIDYLQAQKII